MAKPTASPPPAGPTKKVASPAARPKASAPARGASGAAAQSRASAPSLLAFFQESRAELRKVTWPSRQETINLTVAVIVMTVTIAVFLGIVDQILTWIVTPIIGGH